MPKLYLATCLFLLLQLFYPGHSFAFNGPITKYLGIEQGLSNNSVRCIYRDHNGFMWFGTFDGLNRYDGYAFKTFRNKSNDSTSLVHNYINTIGEDRQNNLWVGTGQGIGIYNNLTSKFLPAFYVPYGGKQKERIPFSVNVIRTDAKGNLYIATSGGGLLVQPAGSSHAFQLPCTKDAQGICRNDVQGLVIDKKQKIWLLINDIGLCFYDPDRKEIRLVNDRLKATLCMETDGRENLWIGTFEGLYQYHISSGSLTRSYYEAPGRLTSNVIFSLCFDRQNRLWIGTEGGGINIVDPATGKLSYILPGESKNSLSSETVNTLYEDMEGRKWIGTLKGGINIIGPQANRFRTITHDPLNPNSLPSSFVNAFYEDRYQNLWIGTDGGGLSIWDRVKNSFTNYRHVPGNPHSLSHNSIPSIRADHLGNIWIATFGGGVNKFNRPAGTFERYPCINELTGGENNYVWLLYEDRDSNLWAATYANGRLYRLNRQADRFEVFSQEFVDFFSMAGDRDGSLWAGTVPGLFQVDKGNKTYIRHVITKPVRAIHEDKKGRFWIGTEGLGLILFNREKGKIEASFTDEEGLCNNSVLNILEDDKGYLWLSTFNGLSRFNPADKTFKNFYQEDGLQSNQFLYNAALRLRSGELAFGGIKGFTLFHPDSIYARYNRPPVILTGLRINNNPVMDGSPYITSVSGDKIGAVRIPYDEAVLSFDFAALEYSAPRKVSYAYYLQGWDKGWNYSGSLRTANYTRLSEGTYTLRVKATTADGAWNPQEVRLKIRVLPPWYRSWWAYTFYVLIAGGAIVLYQRYRIYQAKLKYEVSLAHMKAEKQQAELEIERAELEKERAEKERKDAELALEKAEKEKGKAELAVKRAELEIEKAERETDRVKSEKEREINEKRHSFFTHVSHEFRTPLTLIINPIKDLLQKSKESETAPDGELPVVYRNARRLLSLVDELLLFRKAESGADRVRPVKMNLGAIAKEAYLCFVQQARSRHITYVFDCGQESLEIYADPQKLEIILYNLLSNSLKYTGTGGSITLRISERENDVEVVVKDTGAGIPKEVGDRLFEKFYQPNRIGVPAIPGFGIGLYLVKHFTEQHKGHISYQSEEGKGTTFTLVLQKGKDHFGPDTVISEGAAESMLLQEMKEENDWEEVAPAGKELQSVHDVVSEKKSMLIVDDDEQIRRYLVQLFKENYTIHQAGTGEEGLKQAQKYLPDLVISDVNMAGMNGIDLCRTIKDDASLNHIPVILLSSSTSDESRLQGVEGGADDYILKPFDKNLLLARVATILKSRTKLQNYFFNEITLQKNTLKVSAEYKEFLDNCIAIVEQHIDDPEFSINKLVLELRTSRSNLYKKVKSISGLSTSAFVRFIRLRKAAELFINTSNNINETAAQVGFNDIKYFREQFFKLFGMKPSDYIKKYRKAFGKSFNLNEDEFKGES